MLSPVDDGETTWTGREPFLVIETEKAEVEAPASGTLLEITGQVEETCPIGEVLAVIDVPGGG